MPQLLAILALDAFPGIVAIDAASLANDIPGRAITDSLVSPTLVRAITTSAGASSSLRSDCCSNRSFTTHSTTFSFSLLLASNIFKNFGGTPVRLLITEQVSKDLVVSHTAHELVLYSVVGLVDGVVPRTLA